MLHSDQFKYLKLHFRATRCPHGPCTCLWTTDESQNAFSIFIGVKISVQKMSVAFSHILSSLFSMEP